MQTPYAQNHVTDWYDKLQDVIQNQEANNEEQVVLETTYNSREEWMIIANLRVPFENNYGQSSFDNWQQDRTRYTEQQIGEIPTWIKNHKEQANYVNAQSHVIILVNSFSEMQKLAYEIIKRHFENLRNSTEIDPLCLIVTGGAGTGKSYLINGVCNLLQDKCAVTATTGKASYNVKGVTIHSLLKLPVGPRGNKDLTGQNLYRLQESLSAIDYILIDEYSMLGQTLLGWIDKRCKQASGYHGKVLGGKSFILIGDPGQLPPVADKPLYHEKPSNAIGEQGFQTYQMFDKVVKLNVNQRVQGISTEHEGFRNLLLRLRKGESTYEDWQILLSCQPSNIVDISQFNDAIRLFYSNEQVATNNYEQLIKTAQPIAQINASHSPLEAKKMPCDEMSGLHPTIHLAKGAKVMLTMNLWANVGLCNGATGKVIDIIYENGHNPPDLPIAVVVQCDDYRGPSISDILPSCVPVRPITVSAQFMDKSHERQQIPLKLAYALTIHKSQGFTLSKAWIDISKSEKTPGIAYVALSKNSVNLCC